MGYSMLEEGTMRAIMRLGPDMKNVTESLCKALVELTSAINSANGVKEPEPVGHPDDGLTTFYVTFGFDHPFKKYQAVIRAETEDDARTAARKIFGVGMWAGIYDRDTGKPSLPTITGCKFGDLDRYTEG